MKRLILFISIALLTLQPMDCRAQGATDRERILDVIERIDEAYRKLQSYACDIEGIYFVSGRESERYEFRFYFRKPNLFRIEFRSPYPGVTIFYTEGEREFTSRPLAAFPSIQFRFSVDNPLFKSPSGQGVNQMHLFYFLKFLRQNTRNLPQEGADFRSNGETLSFWIHAKDYVTGAVAGTIPHAHQHRGLASRSLRAVRSGRHSPGIHNFQELQDQPGPWQGILRPRVPGPGLNAPGGTRPTLAGGTRKTTKIRTTTAWRVHSWQIN